MDKEEIYRRYHQCVNMSYAQLLTWSKTEWSHLASLDRRPIQRNLRLLKKAKKDWNATDVRDGRRTISFVARMKGVRGGEMVCPVGSRRDVALLNWGFDPNK